jgi:cell division protein FtsN
VFRFPRWILFGTGLFLLLLFILNRPRHAEVVAAPRNVPAPAPVEAPPPTPAPRSPVAAPPQPSAPKPSSVEGRAIWRVIAFTYRTNAAAEKKVQQLNQYQPGLNATVFSPKGQVYYLVSLGGRMTREDAVRLQHTARSKGLPRDLYVQNYSE